MRGVVRHNLFSAEQRRSGLSKTERKKTNSRSRRDDDITFYSRLSIHENGHLYTKIVLRSYKLKKVFPLIFDTTFFFI